MFNLNIFVFLCEPVWPAQQQCSTICPEMQVTHWKSSLSGLGEVTPHGHWMWLCHILVAAQLGHVSRIIQMFAGSVSDASGHHRHISILFPVVSSTFLCFTKDWKYFCSFFTIGKILWGYILLVYHYGTTAHCLISILYLYFLNSKYKPKETCSFPFASFTDFKEEMTQTDNLNVCK